MICRTCDTLFCYHHRVLWHDEHTCEQYDKSRHDPNYRSPIQIENARLAGLERQSRDLLRQITIANEDWESRLVQKDESAKLRKIELARLRRERREEEERQREEMARLEDARKACRAAEDQLSESLVDKIFVRCPYCEAPVEKIDGW